jgi:lysophospholipase L1-like esterase
MQNIHAARTELGHVDTWIIALGTNDRFATRKEIRARVGEVVAALGTDRFVWIGLGFYNADSRLSERVNLILQHAIAMTPNGRYADWNSYIHDPARASADLWIYPQDNLHMTDRGYEVRARFYARSLN